MDWCGLVRAFLQDFLVFCFLKCASHMKVCLELIRKLDCFQGHYGPHVSHWLMFNITQGDKSYVIPFVLGI